GDALRVPGALRRTGTGSVNLARFPFPLTADVYRYSTNVEPARVFTETATGGWGDRVIDVDEHYRPELALRSRILARDPSRCTVLPHMRPAAWDALILILHELVVSCPEHMELRRDGSRWHWKNGLLGVEQSFVFGDEASLPCDPLTFAGGQAQEDLVLLDQREGTLWADAGLVTFAADWSLNFVIGMPFLEIHGPVPRIREERVITRAEQFLLRLQAGADYRRTNWSMTVDRRLDTSTENSPEWARERRLAVAAGQQDRLHLRVEVQHLIRLAGSGAILFLIRTYLAPLTEVARIPQWRHRFGRVLAELPQDMAEYKGLVRYRELVAVMFD
ncbi:MAG: DUF3445 domain-containing protein, partial [Streptosporangiaceae bacterium]